MSSAPLLSLSLSLSLTLSNSSQLNILDLYGITDESCVRMQSCPSSYPEYEELDDILLDPDEDAHQANVYGFVVLLSLHLLNGLSELY